MSTPVIVYVLTALAALVVVLTWVRLAGESGAGRSRVPAGLVRAHTVLGGAALAGWLTFLIAPGDSLAGSAAVGIAALGLWWATVAAGLMILARWLPTRGRHASAGTQDSWSEGPGLSVLAHVGLLLGVAVFTGAYLTAAV